MANERILVVDDEPDVGKFFQKILSEEGYRVMSATSGPEALSIIEKVAPEIVFLDIKMPEMDGMETFRRIRKISKKMVVIIITGYGSLKTAKEAMALGAYDYVSKPFNLESIKSMIQEALEEK
jgi:two-component system nitrogen regulation response regulator GlnG